LLEELQQGRKGAAEILVAGVNIRAMQHMPTQPLSREPSGHIHQP
jgi:hypothetical protein